MTTLNKILVQLEIIKNLQDKGHSLQQITKDTYEMRERGDDMIYFGWGTKGEDGYLIPNPIAKQKEYKEFFNQIADGAKGYTKYSLYIYKDRIIFTENKKVNGVIIKTNLV